MADYLSDLPAIGRLLQQLNKKILALPTLAVTQEVSKDCVSRITVDLQHCQKRNHFSEWIPTARTELKLITSLFFTELNKKWFPRLKGDLFPF